MAPPLGRPPGRPGVGARRRPRWSLLLVVLLLVVPLLEIAVIVAVGRAIGGWPTFLLLLAESAFGAWLVRREGARAWRSLSHALSTGQMPSRELADGALVLVGGTLLLAPGFLTDIVGFLIVIPFTRPLARRVLEAVIARRLAGVAAAGLAGRFAGAGFSGPGFPGHGFPGAPTGAGAGGGRRTQRSTERSADGPQDDVIEGEIL